MTTSGSGGQTLKKTVTVTTDDPENKEIKLTIKGQVDKFYTLTPKSVKLKGVQGEDIKQTVTLVPEKAYHFALKEITAKRGQNIQFQLEEIEDKNGIRYELTIENTRTEAGVYFDTLYLKTDSDRKPEIQISVFGSVTKAPDPATEEPMG